MLERPAVSKTALTALLLAAILAGAAYLRCVGLDWDAGQHLHPDERFLAQVEGALAPAASVREYFDTVNSPLNPNNRGYGFYVYGDLPLILVHWAGRWFGRPGNDLDQTLFGVDLGPDAGTVTLVGRGFSVACDLIALFALFAVGLRLYGRAVGLVAAALYAAAVLPIQQSHFFTVDACASMFVVIAFWFAAGSLEAARWSDDALLGLALGFGMACKLSVAPVALIAVLATAVRIARNRQSAGLPALVVRGGAGLSLVLLAALLAFRLGQPYAFLPAGGAAPSAAPPGGVATDLRGLGSVLLRVRPNPAWLDQMRQLARLMSGEVDHPPIYQWTNRRTLLFPWTNMVRFGLGWPLGLTAWVGWLWALAQILRRRGCWPRHVLPVAWIGVLFVWQGCQLTMSMRYFLPIYPFLSLLAGWLLIALLRPPLGSVKAHQSAPLPRLAGMTMLALVLLSTFAWAFAFTRIYTRPHTRIVASRWIYEHVPSDATLTMQADDGLYTYQIGLPHNWTPAETPAGDPTAPAVEYTYLAAGEQRVLRFTPPRSGRLVALTLNHILDPAGAVATRDLREALGTNGGPVAAGTAPGAPRRHAQRGVEYPVEVQPMELFAGRRYLFQLGPLARPLVFSGATIATEGAWDDTVPLPLPGYNAWRALYHQYPLEMSWEDTPQKRARLRYVLDHADYIVISSNRFYGALTRLPRRFPMSIDYYRALFAGRLGFELVREFSSPPTLGSLRFDDQSAEEAFTVYDHPRVFLFRKTAAYRSEVTAEILGRANLDAVVKDHADRATGAPVSLPLPADGLRKDELGTNEAAWSPLPLTPRSR